MVGQNVADVHTCSTCSICSKGPTKDRMNMDEWIWQTVCQQKMTNLLPVQKGCPKIMPGSSFFVYQMALLRILPWLCTFVCADLDVELYKEAKKSPNLKVVPAEMRNISETWRIFRRPFRKPKADDAFCCWSTSYMI